MNVILLADVVDTFERIGIPLAVGFGANGFSVGYRNREELQAKERQQGETPADDTQPKDPQS